jgi:hypothetical protein
MNSSGTKTGQEGKDKALISQKQKAFFSKESYQPTKKGKRKSQKKRKTNMKKI